MFQELNDELIFLGGLKVIQDAVNKYPDSEDAILHIFYAAGHDFQPVEITAENLSKIKAALENAGIVFPLTTKKKKVKNGNTKKSNTKTRKSTTRQKDAIKDGENK